MTIATPDMLRDEQLAKLPLPTLDNSFRPEDMQRIARLAMLITNEQLVKNALRPGPRWEAMSDAQREMSARGVLRIVQAMVLLGWIAPP